MIPFVTAIQEKRQSKEEERFVTIFNQRGASGWGCIAYLRRKVVLTVSCTVNTTFHKKQGSSLAGSLPTRRGLLRKLR